MYTIIIMAITATVILDADIHSWVYVEVVPTNVATSLSECVCHLLWFLECQFLGGQGPTWINFFLYLYSLNKALRTNAGGECWGHPLYKFLFYFFPYIWCSTSIYLPQYILYATYYVLYVMWFILYIIYQ